MTHQDAMTLYREIHDLRARKEVLTKALNEVTHMLGPKETKLANWSKREMARHESLKRVDCADLSSSMDGIVPLPELSPDVSTEEIMYHLHPLVDYDHELP